jgi:hypothetical protein
MVEDLHGIVDLIEGIVELGLCDNQRRCDVKDWSTDPHEDAVFEELLLELDNSRRVRVLELSLDELAILADEIEGSEETSQTTLSEAIMLRKELIHALIHDLLHFLDIADNILVDHVLHGLVASNAADWVSLVSSTPADSISPVEILDILSEAYS